MKKQLKKSLSLFLAVLMLLSSWVWIAPEKAEAATTGNYPMTLVWNVSDEVNGGIAQITVTYKNMSTGASTTATYNMDDLKSKTGTVTWTGSIPGFPTNFSIKIDNDGMRSCDMALNTITIGNRTIGTGTWTYKSTWGSVSKNYPQAGGGDWGDVTPDWPTPSFPGIDVAVSPAEHTLPKFGGSNVSSTVTCTTKVDIYGVTWTPANYSYAVRGQDDKAVGNYITASGSGASRTYSISPNIQTVYPNQASSTVFVDVTAEGTTYTKSIKLNHPEYTITFNANDGKIGADSNNSADTVTVGGTDSKLYYGAVIGKSPAYRTKEGFTFKGFYSTKNSDATGLTASFSGTLFKDSETTVSTQGDMTYYAAWQAAPVTATFVTADNQLIGTLEGRYNNNMTASNMYNGQTNLNNAVKANYTGNSIQFDSNGAPVYKDGSTTYTFDHWKIIKAYDDSVVDGNENTIIKGDVTFQAVYRKADAATYTVTFYDGNGNVLSTNSDYKFRDNVVMPTNEPTKAQDDKYTYEFAGWANNIGKNFYVVDEYNKDENGAVISYTAKDGAEFTVRGDASYVPVFRMIPREYSVTFNYTVDGGATDSVTVGGYHWDDGITMPEGIKDNYTQGGYRYYIDGWKVGSDATKKQLSDISVNGDLTLTATYGAGEPAKYTINFYDKDGNLLNGDSNIYEHNSLVTAPDVSQTIDTEDSLYTFSGFNTKKDGTGSGVSTTATGDADYYAIYTKKDYADIHYYNYDGTLIYELDGKTNSLFVGEKIPAYDEETYEVPEKAEDVVGTYNFTGWANSSGETVVPGTDKFTGDTYLYAQFSTTYKNYTVKFVNDDGSDVSEETYHYGEEIIVPETNPTKAADKTYTYKFKAWTPDVSEVCYGDATYTATYSKDYKYYTVTWLDDAKNEHSRSNYKYNEKIQQAVINESAILGAAPQGYTWALKEWIQCNENGDPIGEDGLVVTDVANAVRFVRGMRIGTEHLYFYPVFEAVQNVLTVSFYKEDGTTKIGDAKVPYGESLADYSEAFEEDAKKAADETNHYTIEKWVNVDGETDVTNVTANVSVKPQYKAEAHNKQIYEVLIAPTCTDTGLANMKCVADVCDIIDYNVVLDVIPDEGNPTGQIYVGADKWTLENFKNIIDYTDVKFVGPTTNVIVNAQDTGSTSEPWNEEGKISRGVGKIDYYVSEEEVDPSGIQNWTNIYDYEAVASEVLNSILLSNGLTMRDYIIYSGTPGSKEKAAIDSEVNAILATYNANATGSLSDLNLVNGNEYIIYIRVSDREVNGDSNKCYFSSGKIHYGTTAAEITVTGDGYGTKFCEEATIKVTDDTDGFKTYLDGEEITLTDDGEYTCDDAGVHNITVIDKNGNKSTKSFEIKGNHTYRNYTVAATCENAGSRYDLCTLCGVKANEEIIAALGHSFTVNYTEKAPTCVVDGYRTYTCDNNCGEKLIVSPSSGPESLELAKKYVEPADGEDEGTWVSITADDLKHLKATGIHTYAKVLDKDGEETAEDAWVIDKAATCSVEGSKHKDCTKCGARVTDVIPLDTVNGHKFYREKVEIGNEPTCTEEGKRTQTCRYCDYVKDVEEIPALGHTAGEYRVITAATCEGEGSKILTCSVCAEDIGEPIKDSDGNVTDFDGKAVEIPALGHSWKLDGDLYEGTKKDEEGNEVKVWYQNYICRNDSTHTKTEETEYEVKTPATVTFMNGDNDANPQVLETYVGETISGADVTEPSKAKDETYTYTFKYWATKNDDGTFTEVKFPIEVEEGGATYYAVYKETFINYTITYYKEDGTTEYKTQGFRHNGVEYALLSDGPVKADTWQYKYAFAGWAVYVDEVDEDGNTVTDESGETVKVLQVVDKVKFDGANVKVYATYTETLKQYAVTYAYTMNDTITTFMIAAGSDATEKAPKNVEPKNAYDANYHYEFKGWNNSAKLEEVQGNVVAYAVFEGSDHTCEVTGTKAVVANDCTSAIVETYTCECGYSYTKTVPGTNSDHLWGEPTVDENGILTYECTREDCTVTKNEKRRFTVKFYITDTNVTTKPLVTWGTTLTAADLPANPTKTDETGKYSYTFKGWAYKETPTVVVDITKVVVKSDLEFVPVFTATPNKYRVTFAYNASDVIYTVVIDAGENVTFTGDTPVKAFDENYHYKFREWSIRTGANDDATVNVLSGNTVSNVLSDIYLVAEFDNEAHSYETESLGTATCTNGAGTRYICKAENCGKFYDVTGKPLPHDFVVVERVEATEGKDGYINYECSNNCGATKTETLVYTDNYMYIEIYVNDNDGKPVEGAVVQLYRDNETDPCDQQKTNSDGQVVFRVEKGHSYSYLVAFGSETTDGKKPAGEGSNSVTIQATKCSCACHGDGLWASIFRFFHKIIKMFTGEFKCCKDPDSRY